MPDAATAPAPSGVVPAIPFVSSAHEYVENFGTRTVTPTTTAQTLDAIDVPAYGFLRNIVLEITASGGVAGPGVVSGDYPFNLISGISLQDVNGANIFGPMDGYSLYLANLFGGYTPRPDARDNPTYNEGMVTPGFTLRVPVEITRKNGLGALPNQSSSSNYKLSLSVNTIANMFSTPPTTPPTFTVRLLMEAWTIPAPTDAYGNVQAQVPPLVGMGQYWTTRTQSGIIVGNNTVEFKRVGNYIRTLIIVGRNASGVRTSGVLPTLPQIVWDGITVRKESAQYNRTAIYEKLDGLVNPLPAGVLVYPFNHGGEGEGNIGNEDADLWLPTTQSTRLYMEGDYGTAGSIQVITNDVSSVEASPVSRYVSPNATGRLLAPAQ